MLSLNVIFKLVIPRATEGHIWTKCTFLFDLIRLSHKESVLQCHHHPVVMFLSIWTWHSTASISVSFNNEFCPLAHCKCQHDDKSLFLRPPWLQFNFIWIDDTVFSPIKKKTCLDLFRSHRNFFSRLFHAPKITHCDFHDSAL